MPMRNVPGIDREPGFEGYRHDHCDRCGGVTCGFLHRHKGDYSCTCGADEECEFV